MATSSLETIGCIYYNYIGTKSEVDTVVRRLELVRQLAVAVMSLVVVVVAVSNIATFLSSQVLCVYVSMDLSLSERSDLAKK